MLDQMNGTGLGPIASTISNQHLSPDASFNFLDFLALREKRTITSYNKWL